MNKYLELARELKKLWNMKVTVIPIIVWGYRTTPKNLEKKLEETGDQSKDWLVWFGLVWFYGISTIVGYLMPILVYTYILDIHDL